MFVVYSMGFMGGVPFGSVIVGFVVYEVGVRVVAILLVAGLGIAVLAFVIGMLFWCYYGSADQ